MRTRLRRLRVDGRTYVWRAEIRHVQGSGDCHRCIRVRAWGSGKTGLALQADLLSVSWPSPWGACATDDAYPTPADVRALITYALAEGWRPEVLGGTYVLSERQHGARFALPRFVLTDRLHAAEGEDPTHRVAQALEAVSLGRGPASGQHTVHGPQPTDEESAHDRHEGNSRGIKHGEDGHRDRVREGQQHEYS